MPFVGIVAIGLLVMAGRLFFVNGLQPSPSVASPLQELDAAIRELSLLSSDTVEGLEVIVVPDALTVPEEPKETAPSEILAVTVTPALPKPEPAPSAQPDPRPKAVTAKSTSNATVRADKAPAPAKPGNWRVQVGAYGSKQAANEAVSKLAKSGYKATVFSGAKFHKVWVQAGNSRAAAQSVAARLKKLGYSGSYVVPPAR